MQSRPSASTMNEFQLCPSYLTRQEIRRRPGQFLLSVLAVAAGVAAVLGVLGSQRAGRRQAEALLRNQERELDGRYAAYREELAAAMTKAGFQTVILPRDQNLADWHHEDHAARSLPPDTVGRLRARPLDTLEHLLPRLSGRLEWPERRWTVLVYGTAAEILHPSPLGERWLDRTVPPGQADVGDAIVRAFGLAPGQDLAVAGRVVRIRRCREPAGAKDDIALHLALEDAQAILGRPGEVNEILALQRPAAWGDAARIRAELAERLPEAQAVEIGNRVVANLRARRMAEEESASLLAQARERQENLLRSQARLGLALAAVIMALMIPLLNLLCVLIFSLYAGDQRADVKTTLLAVAKNPLMLGCLLGIVLNVTGIGLPGWSQPVMEILSRAALPLGLLAVGVALNLEALRRAGQPLILSSLIKLLLIKTSNSLKEPSLEMRLYKVIFYAN